MKEILNCAMDIGELMVVSGAEVHRVEDSIDRICRSLGASRVDCFIIISSMVVTLHDAEGHAYTQTRRIRRTGTDFHRLDLLNALSRRICDEKLSVEAIKAEFTRITNAKTYPLWLEFVLYAMAASAFTVFFGGNWQQALVSLFVGAFVRLVVFLSDCTVKNLIFAKFISSLFVTALTFLAITLWTGLKADEIIIGNIMLLIPGLGFTNALRDLFTGDSVAGILRSLEALLSAVAIAAGYFVFVFVSGGITV
ncbi:MAG: threonine/serine exporter family protein [Clostridia bacterium]|nr:threonine/serine exporter family protein [Clostridia bacterium]